MDAQKLSELSKKYLDGTATEEEKRLLHQWYESVGDDGEEIVFLDEKGNEDKLGETIFSRIQNNIAQEQGKTTKRRGLFSLKTKLAAAAAILFLATGAAYFLFNQDLKGKPLVNNTARQTAPVIIAPGSDKATLTLANGSTIVLDSTNHGVLGEQGNARITQTAGKLNYEDGSAHSSQLVYNALATPHGGKYEVTLSDGTKVWLNSLSSLRFPASFTGKERKVEITGEAYFEVAKNKSMPFIVMANGMKIEVVGTHFNIMSYADEKAIKATLVEGFIKASNGQESTTVEPGQQAQLHTNGKLSLIKTVDVEQVLAWKNGYFHFNDTNIEEIMRQIKRWYDVDVEYHGNTGKLNFGGVFSKRSDASELLKILEATETVDFKLEGKKIIVNVKKDH